MVMLPKFCAPYGGKLLPSSADTLKSITNVVSLWSDQIKYDLLHFALHRYVVLTFSELPKICLAFSEPERLSAVIPATYNSLPQCYSLLTKLCLCYAVYLMILLKLQYCYFTF